MFIIGSRTYHNSYKRGSNKYRKVKNVSLKHTSCFWSFEIMEKIINLIFWVKFGTLHILHFPTNGHPWDDLESEFRKKL